MADQTLQRQAVAKAAAEFCTDLVAILHRLNDLAEKRPYLGNFVAEDFAGTPYAYLDAGTVGALFDFVVPELMAVYNRATTALQNNEFTLTITANVGRNKQILNQMAK